ncbi:hypothetical protein STRIP9103_09115 [Streptomyces ipomoeae 91-03]|uniref:Uncharacterized protein n=1 Tax=Streptomyces ipomoeae 91-03 TaxID=698759 RepID=L1KK04_9ACTN|nr:hypothetical protein STRIP9103_09115 [Streptomyces ipomoeae 91-03]
MVGGVAVDQCLDLASPVAVALAPQWQTADAVAGRTGTAC